MSGIPIPYRLYRRPAGADRVFLLAVSVGGLSAFHCVPNASAWGQTLQPTPVVERVICRTYWGIPTGTCDTITVTARMHSAYTRGRIDRYLFGATWATASHCTRVDTLEAKCKRSVSVATDPAWNRLIWGQMDNFVRSYGRAGDGAERFWTPLGVDITRREGEWHVAFVADSRNNRIAVIAVGYACKCVKWLGTIDGWESGVRLNNPHDVAWDHNSSWELTDDRVYIADTDNHRVVVYGVSVDPVNGTMTKQFLGAFGSQGSASGQLLRPKGIAVRPYLVLAGCKFTGGTFYCSVTPATAIYVSDTGNGRVSKWAGTSSFSFVSESAPVAGSEFIGATVDYYGDVYVADRARDCIVKFSGKDLTLLKTYGGSSSWASGSFNDPTDVHVVWHYALDSEGGFVSEGLPYVETTERWTDATGGQLHRLGVDVDELAVSVPNPNGGREATFTFLFTGNGEYTVSVKNNSGAVVRSWPAVVADGGRKSQYWDGTDAAGNLVPYGTYTVEVRHRSGYTYDTSPRISLRSFTFLSPFTVTANAPCCVTQKATYTNYGSASHTATGWRWDQSWDNRTWSFVASTQNMTWTASAGSYTIYWRLFARRVADGTTGYGFDRTDVCIGTSCKQPPLLAVASAAPDSESGAGDSAAAGPRFREITPERRGDHYGSGAWIGARAAEAPYVVQLYSLSGTPEAAGSEWPNAFGGRDRVVQQANLRADAPFVARAIFTRVASTGQDRAYDVRFERVRAKVSDFYVGLALDPDLGAVPEDDLLGVDPATGLVWVVDPDSGALGYVLTHIPHGAAVTVRQFSNRLETRRPEPVTDAEAYSELSAQESALTSKRDDVRFVISVGPVPLASRDVEVGLVILRGSSLASLRERATRLSGVPLASAGAAEVGVEPAISQFRFTQAPPDPAMPPGVARISLSVVPGLASGSAPGLDEASAAELRAAVKKHGITALAFVVPDGTPAVVTIRVYDASGRLVRTLTDGTYDPGAYRVQWDLLDERGARVSPGVYLAIMEAPGFRDMTKLVVLP